MRREWSAAIAYALLVGGLLAAYYGSKIVYRPFVPPVLDLGLRQSNIGYSLYEQRRVSQAIELCRAGLKSSPNSALLHYNLAYIYGTENMPNEAIAEYRQAIRCQPDWARPHIDLGIILGKSGRLEEAAEEFRRAGNDPDARYNLELTERALQRRTLGQPKPGR